MANDNFKSVDISDARTDSPPSYSGPSAYTILTGPTNEVDLEEPPPVTQTAEYRALHRRYCHAKAFLALIMPLFLFSVAYMMYNLYDNARRGEVTSCSNTTVVNGNTTHTMFPRATANRRCLAGYTEQELVLESLLLADNYGNKARTWMSPCSEVDGINYPSDAVAEFDYVVLRS